MSRFLIAALLACTAVVVRAETFRAIAPAPDSAEQRQQFRSFSMCLAQARPGWARGTLSHPYLSEAQAGAASEALRGTDTCLRGRETEFVFRTSSLVGELAEFFLRSEMDRADPARVAVALSTMEPLNASEDFALCVAAGNPVAARELALSEPGSAAEDQAAGQLAPHVQGCLMPHERQPVDVQALRALVATALYRGVAAVIAARN